MPNRAAFATIVSQRIAKTYCEKYPHLCGGPLDPTHGGTIDDGGIVDDGGTTRQGVGNDDSNTDQIVPPPPPPPPHPNPIPTVNITPTTDSDTRTIEPGDNVTILPDNRPSRDDGNPLLRIAATDNDIKNGVRRYIRAASRRTAVAESATTTNPGQ